MKVRDLGLTLATARRQNLDKRTQKKEHLSTIKTKNDYTRAGYLSLFLLWNKPTLKESIKDFNRRVKKNDWEINM